MEDTLVTLKTFTYPSEAYPLMERLESEGIECFLDGENTVSVHPFLSNAIGGVKLKIKKSDSEKALEIIKLNKQVFEKEEQDNDITPDAISKGFVIKVETFCPKCDSLNVYRKKIPSYKIIIAILSAFILLPFLIKKEYYCADCKHIWKR